MAVGKISGKMLLPDLTLDEPLKFSSSQNSNNLLYIDTTTSRIGIGTDQPSSSLDIDGDVKSTTSTIATSITIAEKTKIDNTKISSLSGNLVLEAETAQDSVTISYLDVPTTSNFQQNITTTGLLISSIPTDSVLISTTNGQLTSDTNLTYTNNRINVPSISIADLPTNAIPFITGNNVVKHDTSFTFDGTDLRVPGTIYSNNVAIATTNSGITAPEAAALAIGLS